ncbi:hypothetical protein DUNSADRAFT_2312 [Dunaliella salina]|uniref:Encoded protein n=1 Tax=Dunaliella salina TaxID=3046 RepID=A0ABQ7FWG8_DUNSA|nr:hypothetical protein DUNSADRAFT_2312 [Dunaliella salina]KAF5826703.1 hypothetical protein DUNSADRAFT_2312 [Dunaliella salina]|eukprot:KAF5826702.1 hypothetical protein DUNSADRAFT_2312 [Dunaliella salina]
MVEGQASSLGSGEGAPSMKDLKIRGLALSTISVNYETHNMQPGQCGAGNPSRQYLLTSKQGLVVSKSWQT